MEDDQTPIEGKGDEMIPNRGIPFDGISDEPENEGLEYEELDETALSDEVPLAEPTAETSPLLELEEIREREMELAEDSHTLPPDLEGEIDQEFAAARIPIQIPSADREAIMLESGAGILDEAAILSESEEEETPPTPDTEAIAEITTLTEDEEISSEPVPESGADSVTKIEIPTKEAVRGIAIFDKEALELPGPVGEVETQKAPETVSGLKATKKMLDLLVPNKRVEELWNRADALQKNVFEEVNDLNLARSLLEQLRSAKTLILADKENYEEAERALNEVEYRVVYGQRFSKWGSLGYTLLVYEVFWGTLTIVAMYFLIRGGVEGLNLHVEGLLSGNEIFIGILAALFGALGGVAGALFALWRYITQQKFNPQFSIWYITQPIIGLVIGSVIYIILKIGFNITAGTVTAEIGSPLLPSLLAYLAGFQQNVFMNLARQILKQFEFSEDKGKKNEETAE